MENGTPSDGKDPSAFLSEIIGAPVTVKLNSGVVYKGFSPTWASVLEPIYIWILTLFLQANSNQWMVT